MCVDNQLVFTYGHTVGTYWSKESGLHLKGVYPIGAFAATVMWQEFEAHINGTGHKDKQEVRQLRTYEPWITELFGL